mmetsp:Transcript_26453/g.84061  ORF Transcript_26453/g.84061 Transcript_26453/m.84061 type:complete len:230 (-) Transcript_26453:126-815(-)
MERAAARRRHVWRRRRCRLQPTGPAQDPVAARGPQLRSSSSCSRRRRRRSGGGQPGRGCAVAQRLGPRGRDCLPRRRAGLLERNVGQRGALGRRDCSATRRQLPAAGGGCRSAPAARLSHRRWLRDAGLLPARPRHLADRRRARAPLLAADGRRRRTEAVPRPFPLRLAHRRGGGRPGPLQGRGRVVDACRPAHDPLVDARGRHQARRRREVTAAVPVARVTTSGAVCE